VEASGNGSAFTPATLWRANFQNTECKYWPRALGASGTVTSSAPIVFLNGTADPADPPANVADAAVTMPNSLVVPIPGYGHSVLDQDLSACLADKVAGFIAAGKTSTAASWQSCRIDLPAFVTQ
jgi:pimeloyl-ACP methyl ester carboxylesterase